MVFYKSDHVTLVYKGDNCKGPGLVFLVQRQRGQRGGGRGQRAGLPAAQPLLALPPAQVLPHLLHRELQEVPPGVRGAWPR